MQRQVPLSLCFLAGVFMFVQFFIPVKWMETIYSEALTWAIVISFFAYFLGLFSLVRLHANKVKRNQPDKIYSVVTLAGLAVMLFFGLVLPLAGLVFGFDTGLDGIGEGTVVNWVFYHMQVPMQATMFSILAFYIASAAYRAFRIKNLEAALLLFAAILVMIGRVPLGHAISEFFPDAANWILTVPNLATKRGIMIGGGLGMISMSLKIILGIERHYLGGD